jgi:hypothetical protein
MKKVFISSTSRDLADYRRAAIDTCLKLGLFPIAMEYFEAMSAGATEGSKRKLDEADLYVGFFAFRYGYIEKPTYDRGVTELEFDHAIERRIDRLCFIADESHPWPPNVIDTENLDLLKAFKKRVQETHIVSFFTTVDNFANKLMHALLPYAGSKTSAVALTSTAVFAKTDSAVPEQPDRLIGRDDLQKRIHALLDQHKRVLLQGFGGMGKTALAATVAAQRPMPVLWLKAGHAEADALFEALARPFNAQQIVAGATGDARLNLMRDLLAQSGAKLLVLDDAWNGEALSRLLRAVPRDLPMLVTSRERFPIGEIIRVDELAPDAALELLGFHARQDYVNPSPQPPPRIQGGGENDDVSEHPARVLCRKLGYHAYALEIAGKTLHVDDITPAELLKRIETAPHEMKMPQDFADEGRQSVKRLLDASLSALDDETRAVFLAFGALFAPGATPELLARYMNASVGTRPAVSATEYDTTAIETALMTLARRGLAERVPPADNRVASYRIHDLAYSYARAQNTDENRHRARRLPGLYRTLQPARPGKLRRAPPATRQFPGRRELGVGK